LLGEIVPWGEEDPWSQAATPEPRHPVVQKQIWGYNDEGHLVLFGSHGMGVAVRRPSDKALTLMQCHPGKKRKWNMEMLVEMLDTGKGVDEVMVTHGPKATVCQDHPRT